MTVATADVDLAARLARIPATPALRLLPVRHHSPACARHLETLIRRDKPDVVLIEGPADATPLLPYLGESDARPPLAIYFYYAAASAPSMQLPLEGPVTCHRGFYPLAAFSPEWVAIREGLKLGADVRFIDMPYAERLVACQDMDHGSGSGGGENTLLDDRDLALSDPSVRVVELSGCRDFNEWWDRFYESGASAVEPEAYFRNLLAWCLLLRERHEDGQDSENGIRERYMAAQVAAARDGGKRCLVVTGGFHTEAIARQLNDPAPGMVTPEISGERGLYLVPYTLSRLDAANDYAAGVLHTGYYHEVWQQHRRGSAQPDIAAAETIALRVGHALRQRGESVSLPDCIEAVALSRRLGALRNTPPGRPEILDAMMTAFIKDTRAPELEQRIVRHLSAEVKGVVPGGYPAAPLVEDFRNQCQRFKLPLDPLASQEKALDIYRSERHRGISRLLHRLQFLEIPYATLTAGPDFAAGKDLGRVREIWQLQWTPETDALLTERMGYGSQLEEAALNVLREQLSAQPREAPKLLIAALTMGLHPVLDQVLDRIGRWLEDESEFPALVAGLKLLHLAYSAQNALAARNLPGLEPLLAACFERACLRLTWLGQTDEETALAFMEALGDLNSLARPGAAWADVALFVRCVQSLYDGPGPAPLIGRAAGILTIRQVWGDGRSSAALTAALNQALLDPEYLGGFLLGFLPVTRGFLIQSPSLIEAIGQVILDWDEDTFLNALPQLRLAFTSLKPRETAALAKVIAILAGAEMPVVSSQPEWSPQDLVLLQDLHGKVVQTLARWGFDDAKP